MPLIEFLRKTNSQGRVHRKYRQQYQLLQKHKDPVVAGKDVEEWTNEVACEGQVLIAAFAGPQRA